MSVSESSSLIQFVFSFKVVFLYSCWQVRSSSFNVNDNFPVMFIFYGWVNKFTKSCLLNLLPFWTILNIFSFNSILTKKKLDIKFYFQPSIFSLILVSDKKQLLLRLMLPCVTNISGILVLTCPTKLYLKVLWQFGTAFSNKSIFV